MIDVPCRAPDSQLLDYEQWDDSRKRRLTAKEEIIGRKSHVSLTSWRGWMHLGSGVRSVVTVIPQWGLLEVNRMLCKRFPPSWWLLLHRATSFSLPPTTMKQEFDSLLYCVLPLFENDDSIPNGGRLPFKFQKIWNFFFSPIIKSFKFHKENNKENCTLYMQKISILFFAKIKVR